jgi:tetratricopeptide (TPR) repeat protein
MAITLILLAAALAFGVSLLNGYVYDDYAIFSDGVLFAPSGWWELWLTHTRPLTYLSFWAELQVTGGGENTARVQHSVNLLLHLLAVWLAFGVLNRVLSSRAAWIATLLFAIHPLQGETVNYVWARSTLLMTVFGLLSLGDWLHEWHWRAVAWFALALLAKEECVVFPVFLVLLRFSRARWKPFIAMLAIAVAVGTRVLWLASTTPGSQAGAQAPYSASEYLWTQGLVILRYLRLIVAPVGLTPDPPIHAGMYWWAWLLIAAACAVAVKRFSDAREGFWFISGILLLLPSSSIFPASELAADRRMYLPLLAFAMAIGLALERWYKPALVLVMIILLPLSMVRSRTWASDQTLWGDALRKNPKSVRARLLLTRGAMKPNFDLLEEAKRLAPSDPQVAAQLGRAYLNWGGPERALPEFGRALALAPNSPEALNNRGVALQMLKQSDAARQDFERALKIEPCFWDARYNLKRMGINVTSPAHCRYTPWQQEMLDSI